ncbi:hypothetical protein [Kingella negevensis]|uniref:hypothetical protein n=1 Tax=Kingella negevensis TaxID=1522312 RepID=UPI00050A3275|nr:hypothetical protein [Kingella negevensis]
MQIKYIVQDLETYEFLYPSPDGDVGQTPCINQAGHFEEIQDALDAGEDLGSEFTIFTFYLSY